MITLEINRTIHLGRLTGRKKSIADILKSLQLDTIGPGPSDLSERHDFYLYAKK